MKKQMFAAGLAALLAFGASSAFAAFIDGEISMGGDFVATGGTGLANATGVAFPGGDFEVIGVVGDFGTTVAAGDFGSMADFQFSPILDPSPVDPLWSIGGFEFVMSSVTVDTQNAFFLTLIGTGTLSGNGFDATVGTWNFSGNSLGGLFSFSAGSASVDVPEPATLALLGLGLAGFAVARRRRA